MSHYAQRWLLIPKAVINENNFSFLENEMINSVRLICVAELQYHHFEAWQNHNIVKLVPFVTKSTRRQRRHVSQWFRKSQNEKQKIRRKNEKTFCTVRIHMSRPERLRAQPLNTSIQWVETVIYRVFAWVTIILLFFPSNVTWKIFRWMPSSSRIMIITFGLHSCR